MGQAVKRIEKRKKAKNQISQVMNRAEHVIVIHYSCESFYDRSDGSSPRITSIAVRNLGSGQTTSFSIHQMAERKRYSSKTLEQQYDELEKLMLDDFYEYVRRHSTHTWLHWNMRDINYGFPALAHRYKVLGGQPLEVHEANLVDLSRLLIDIYGVRYIEHPRLESLVKKNKITHRDFLNGEGEAHAFENKEYVKLHQSTLRKVDIFANVADCADNGTLKTNSSWKDVYGSYPAAFGELLKEHWVFSFIGIISAVAGIISFALYFL